MNSTGNGGVDFLGTLGGAQTAGRPAGGASDAVKDISTAEFMAEVIEASAERPVLVDFWAPWCGPCKQLGPVLEKAVADSRGKVKLVKMNIDQYPEIAGQMGVQSIPAVVAFDKGKPKDAFMGAVPESEVRRFIEKLVGPTGPSPVDQALEQAAIFVEQGAHGEAAGLYASVLQQEPENVTALAGMGTLYLSSGDLERAKAMFQAIPADQQSAPEAASLKAAIDLAEQAASLGDTAELLARIEANPRDYDARFDLALALNAAGNREEAADQLLDIIRRDRKWKDDGARTQLLQFFEAWGPTDPDTLSARRQLSSILFS